MKKIICPFLLSFFFLMHATAQDIDVQHYKFEIELSDKTDAINGKATISLQFLKDAASVVLDLASLEEEKGMAVFRVTDGGVGQRFAARNNRLTIFLHQPVSKGSRLTLEIEYMGVPKDGLIISKNKWGERTFFADNWPDRAKNWLPVNDHPNDKASVEFIVTAPAHYRVVSNGTLEYEKAVKNGLTQTHWKEDVPVPTKVMVIGAARFAVKHYPATKGSVPTSAWVYPQDSAAGFYDYALADTIVRFFQNYIAPFPYKKLANVQSKTIFGGMENASAIFYGESTVTGNRSSETLMAHEIAHQWFGNTATEKNFSHLWLSEGFATYMTNLYIEEKYGQDSFYKRLEKERDQVIAFAKTSTQAVVDSTSDYMELLNANSYQKGGWVLHMLRQEVGDTIFRKIIQAYYQQYKEGNADSKDFEDVAERVSRKDLTEFFAQWLYRPGIPHFDIRTKTGDSVTIEIEQGKHLFSSILEVSVMDGDGVVKMHRIPVKDKNTTFQIKGNGPFKIQIDPNRKLLFSYN